MELIKGTLDVMVLRALAAGPMHGYAVSRWIHERTDELLEVEDAALYQALHRLHRRGMLDAEWGVSENNRRAKFYALTGRGREELERETRALRRYADALLRVLAPEPS